MRYLDDRKSQRLKFHDYSTPKSYCVTIKILSIELPLGIIYNDQAHLNCIGKIIDKCWNDIPNHYKECKLDEYIIMPDHIHGIIRINSERRVGNRHACSNIMLSRQYQILPIAIGGFKSAASRLIHQMGYLEFKWQKSYYDRIIRVKELKSKIEYIRMNPIRANNKNINE